MTNGSETEGNMIFTGAAHCFGDDINTDYLSPSKYKARKLTFEEYAQHMLEDIRPGFYESLTPGDILVAGENFGCGSSRESAPRVIQAAKIPVVVAKSFARIFYRNAISLGLPLVEADTTSIREGETIEVDVLLGTIKTDHGTIQGTPLPPVLMGVLLEGGMLANFQKYGSFRLDRED